MSDWMSLSIKISTIIKRKEDCLFLSWANISYKCKHQNLKVREMAEWVNKVAAAKPGDLNQPTGPTK